MVESHRSGGSRYLQKQNFSCFPTSHVLLIQVTVTVTDYSIHILIISVKASNAEVQTPNSTLEFDIHHKVKYT